MYKKDLLKSPFGQKISVFIVFWRIIFTFLRDTLFGTLWYSTEGKVIGISIKFASLLSPIMITYAKRRIKSTNFLKNICFFSMVTSLRVVYGNEDYSLQRMCAQRFTHVLGAQGSPKKIKLLIFRDFQKNMFKINLYFFIYQTFLLGPLKN